ncbi:DUF4376 domain-containing protein [Parabacteroides merdae]|uniref:DUF4376 domain-containing protein n=1 Tax=Parabacteroides merdae TaxID=46503 RepID=A0A414XSI2_9BACT|nr:hypothetical protein [Parabacteroides merdae]RHH76833.1 hypothetical protein DW191_12880 [Parabacteroides merdae]
MKRVEGSADVSLLECTNPVKGKWRVRWDMEAREDGSASYMEEEFDHRPDVEEVRSLISNWYNAGTDGFILSGFEYEGRPVWLSRENQFNYKAAYDLAVQTGGQNLPVTFKLGADDEPYYRTFETVSDLQNFYVKAMKHIQDALSEGWKKKDALDLALYEAG